MIVKRLSEKSGYWQKDVRSLLQCMDEVILEYFGDVTEDEDITVQLVRGVRLKCTVVPKRNRRDPRTQEDIIVKPTVKPACKFSGDFRKQIQDNYDTKKGE